MKADNSSCLLYTSDAADERSSVDLGGRRIIKKTTKIYYERCSKEYTAEMNIYHTNNVSNDNT